MCGGSSYRNDVEGVNRGYSCSTERAQKEIKDESKEEMKAAH